MRTTLLCLLDIEGTNDSVVLSYVFRPLPPNGYLFKRKDGSVTISAKGRALFPDIQRLIPVGGGEKEHQRIMTVSSVAALLARQGISSSSVLLDRQAPYFIPSACWRKIAPGILSTTRFAGMLILNGQKLAVYDIGDGTMEWQVRAEGSLFYTRYGRYETKADGMILIGRDENRNAVAKSIIRQTMWNRFLDDDMEHMAFSVVGQWGEGVGKTVIRVWDFSKRKQIKSQLLGVP